LLELVQLLLRVIDIAVALEGFDLFLALLLFCLLLLPRFGLFF